VTWKLVPAAVTLRTQINLRWADRDHASDGSIGDADHQNRPSDHNPDVDGWVHAIDVDEDLDPNDPGACERLANQLLEYARTKQPGSARLKNIVYEDRVASGTYPDKFWVWRYNENLDHHAHMHISFTDAAEDNGLPFNLPIFKESDDVALDQADIDKVAHAVWNKVYPDPIDSNKAASTASLLLRARMDANKAATRPIDVPEPPPYVLSDADVNRIAKAVLDQQAARLVN
jgi:hypothetical protein